jgi:hypothetical protein
MDAVSCCKSVGRSDVPKMHPHGCWSHSHRHESTAGMSRFKSILFHNFASKIWANLQLQSAATGQLGGLMLPKCILYASTWPPLSGFGLTLFLSQLFVKNLPQFSALTMRVFPLLCHREDILTLLIAANVVVDNYILLHPESSSEHFQYIPPFVQLWMIYYTQKTWCDRVTIWFQYFVALHVECI